MAKLPLIAERLHELPAAELRRLFEALQLTATYYHDRKEVYIEITLHNRGHDGAQVFLTGDYSNRPLMTFLATGVK